MIFQNSGEKVPARLFGTSGIRGLVDKSLTPELAAKAGLTFATFLENKGTVLVGRDVRPQSQLIQNAVMSGLAAGGVDVLDCGVAPTPAVLFALKKNQLTAALTVTGSHTPASITGLLFFLGDTGEMDDRGEKRFEEIFTSERFCRLPWNEVGSVRTLDVLDDYPEQIQKLIGDLGSFCVVVDPGNGAAWATLGAALKWLGCDVITINDHPDGTFPSRSPYPQPSTLGQLSSAVKDAKADLGVGTDSDGDRALFVTELGQVLWGDITGALFTKNELKKRRGGGRIITTVNTSSLIQFLAQEYGGDVTVTKVGPPAIAGALREHRDTIFALEESGKYIWPEILLYGDAAIATGRLLQIMKLEQKSLEELQSELPKFHQLKFALPCPDELKWRALDIAMTMWKETKDVRISTVDGLKVTYSDSSWFLLRASGTEPALRCSAESRKSDEVKRLLDVATKLAQNAITKAKETQRS